MSQKIVQTIEHVTQEAYQCIKGFGLASVVLQPLIDTFIHKTLIHPQYLDFFMSSLMHFFVVLYCVSRETMV